MKKYFYILIFLHFIISCNNTQKTAKKDLKEIAKEVMNNAKNCALITVDSVGVAHVRTMDPFFPEEDFTVWMGTNPKSLKVKQIQKNPKVTLYYFDTKSVSYVTLQGVAKIVNAQSKKEKFWKKEWKNYYKNRTLDYVLIQFTPNKATIISEKYNVLGDSITWKTPELNFNK
ncbi:pyridoxamine 5'-phosphate oxidase family protein [uncultured Polaribacter sp.]|uniref:pyridoxamine 5'-phosphate oxidase family protein n=1 Tax=uncultured Polaribacter sp. TaxID=174711 RepID=UPI002610F895|nr:pyridoxamine 5'-phosphate oxidase family protein [uncultured Polaribacter sp.]